MAIGDRPSTFPRWAYDDGADAEAASVLEPSDGKKDTGSASGGMLTAQEFNWLMTTMYQWLKYYDAKMGTVDHINLGLGYQDGSTTLANRISPQTWASSSSGATKVCIPLQYPVGTRISRIDVETLEPSAPSEEITLKLQEIDGATITQLGDSIVGTQTASVVVQTWDDTNNDSGDDFDPEIEIQAGKQYRILVEFPQTSANNEAQVTDVKVTRH